MRRRREIPHCAFRATSEARDTRVGVPYPRAGSSAAACCSSSTRAATAVPLLHSCRPASNSLSRGTRDTSSFDISMFRRAIRRGVRTGARASSYRPRSPSCATSTPFCCHWDRRVIDRLCVGPLRGERQGRRIGECRVREGFAMLTVLWVITVASIVALGGALVGRNAVNATRNRIQMERAFWTAMGCARRAQAEIDDRLQTATTIEEASLRWRTLDRQVLPLMANAACDASLEAAGTRLDMNAASPEMVLRLLRALGYGDKALEMVDALEDWRDPDDTRRPLGAERDWYLSAGRMPPRNGSLADIRELPRVRG